MEPWYSSHGEFRTRPAAAPGCRSAQSAQAVENQRNFRPELLVNEIAADVKLVIVLVEIANVAKRLPLSKRTAIFSQIHRVKRAADRIDITGQLGLVKIVVPSVDGEEGESRISTLGFAVLRLGAAPYFDAAFPFGTAFRLVGAFLFCIGFSFDGAFPLCAALPLDVGAGVLSW